jgi:hypothetical protein
VLARSLLLFVWQAFRFGACFVFADKRPAVLRLTPRGLELNGGSWHSCLGATSAWGFSGRTARSRWLGRPARNGGRNDDRGDPIDFVLSSVADSSRGKGRLLVESRGGRRLA